MNGQLGIAGEIGHMSINFEGPYCECGNRGCLEMYCSSTALKKEIINGIKNGNYTRLNQNCTLSEIAQAVAEGDRFVVDCYQKICNRLAIGVVNIINMLNPDKIVIDDDFVSVAPEMVREILHKAIRPAVLPQIQRGEGMAKVMADHPEFELIQDFPCDWQADKAANVASDMMNQYGDELVAIICDNDDMSSAAQKTCNDNGRSDVVCVGVDGNQNPLQMVKDGEMGATVLQDGPGQVAGAIEMIKTCLAGETPEKEIAIPFVLVTIDNVDEYLK